MSTKAGGRGYYPKHKTKEALFIRLDVNEIDLLLNIIEFWTPEELGEEERALYNKLCDFIEEVEVGRNEEQDG